MLDIGVIQFAALKGEMDMDTWNFHNWIFIILPDEKKLKFYHSSHIRWCLNVIFEVKNDIF
jgi:hypothetical protein